MPFPSVSPLNNTFRNNYHIIWNFPILPLQDQINAVDTALEILNIAGILSAICSPKESRKFPI